MNKSLNIVDFSFIGHLNEQKLEVLLVEVKRFLENNIDDLRIKRRVYIVAVEALENIFRHTDSELRKQNKIKFSIKFENNSYILEFVNLVFCKNSEKIKKILFNIKNKSKEEIKELYKATITKAQISQKGGAGLGLIEIAKISDNNIDYKFKDIGADICEFILEVKFDMKTIK